ncbi:MAG: JAB domain-containing protein [Opitutaceae bacterium]
MRIYEATIAYNLVQLGDVDVLNTPRKIADYLADAYAKMPYQETLWVICLDRKNKPLSRTMVTLGTLTCSLAHPREIFKIAILASAAAIVISHNHPSGDPAPSAQDLQLTKQLREAAKIIGIDLHDHVILLSERSDKTIYAERRIMPSWWRRRMRLRVKFTPPPIGNLG